MKIVIRHCICRKNNHKKRDDWNIIGNYYQKKNLKITLKV